MSGRSAYVVDKMKTLLLLCAWMVFCGLLLPYLCVLGEPLVRSGIFSLYTDTECSEMNNAWMLPVNETIAEDCSVMCMPHDTCCGVTFADGTCSFISCPALPYPPTVRQGSQCFIKGDKSSCRPQTTVGTRNLVTTGGLLTVVMSNAYLHGSWNTWDACPTGSYAAGIQLEIQPDQGPGDDSAVNVVRLLCMETWGNFREVANVTSGTQIFGDVQPKVLCPTDYWIVSYMMFYQPNQGGGVDDTGVNGIKIQCRGPGMHGTITNDAQSIGVTFPNAVWSPWSASCPAGTAVCSIQTRIESPGDGDCGALTEAKLQCCEYCEF